MDAGRRERYEREGIFVNGARARFSYVTPEEARPVDAVIIATKNAHLPAVIEKIRPAVGEHTMILSLLNGIQSESDLAAAFGAGHVLYGFIVGLSSVHEGKVIMCGNEGTIVFGEGDNSRSPRVQALAYLFQRAGVQHRVPQDIRLEQWKKYLLNVTCNTLSAICRLPYSGFKSPVMQDLVRTVGAEVIAVAKQEGVALTADMLESIITMVSGLDAKGKTSMLQDMEARRKTENPWFCGTVVQLGKKHGIPTSACALLEQLVEAAELSFPC